MFRDAGNEFSALETIGNIAELKWALGDLDGAEASLREYIAMRGRSSVRRSRLAHAFASLSGVLTERGDLASALEAAREGVVLMQQDGGGQIWRFMDAFALRVALAGKAENAARIAGYADARHAETQAAREPNEARARERLGALLSDSFAPEELDRLYAEGAKIDQDMACRLALLF